VPVQLTIKEQGSSELRRKLEKFRVLMPRETKADILDNLKLASVELQKPAPKPSYPISWDSEKQRRAFFASDGFGGGIPYVRTGRGSKAWQVQELATGGTLSNPTKQAVYIWGDNNGQNQSRIHKGRWPLFKKVVDRLKKTAPPSVQSVITGLIRRLGL